MIGLMYDPEAFRTNLIKAREESGLSAAELSRKAGLSDRAYKDIEERKSKSPKLSTVFAFAEALGKDPGEMMGLGPRLSLNEELAKYLSQYDEAVQLKILDSLATLPLAEPKGPKSL